MEIERAIEILRPDRGDCKDREEAIKLGREALKQIRGMRQAIGFDHYTLLQGETRETQ